MTKSRFLKLDRKLSQLSFYNIIYQYRTREIGFIELGPIQNRAQFGLKKIR